MHSNFTSSIFYKNTIPSKFSIPIVLKKHGAARKGVNESLVVLNHLKFVVYTVNIDSTVNKTHNKNAGSSVDKLAISHIEVIPIR